MLVACIITESISTNSKSLIMILVKFEYSVTAVKWNSSKPGFPVFGHKSLCKVICLKIHRNMLLPQIFKLGYDVLKCCLI